MYINQSFNAVNLLIPCNVILHIREILSQVLHSTHLDALERRWSTQSNSSSSNTKLRLGISLRTTLYASKTFRLGTRALRLAAEKAPARDAPDPMSCELGRGV